jgi:hypothetical protein
MRGARAEYTWSAQFSINPPLQFEEIVLNRLGQLVTKFADPEWPISGAVPGSGDLPDRTTLALGLDPSQRYGTPSIKRCETIAHEITRSQGWRREAEALPELRIILGRLVGYEKTAWTFSMPEVHHLAVARGCGNITLAEADLFSLRHIPGEGLQEHHEPGVIVGGSVDQLEALLQVANDMDQKRLVPEITGVETQVYVRPEQSQRRNSA